MFAEGRYFKEKPLSSIATEAIVVCTGENADMVQSKKKTFLEAQATRKGFEKSYHNGVLLKDRWRCVAARKAVSSPNTDNNPAYRDTKPTNYPAMRTIGPHCHAFFKLLCQQISLSM